MIRPFRWLGLEPEASSSGWDVRDAVDVCLRLREVVDGGPEPVHAVAHRRKGFQDREARVPDFLEPPGFRVALEDDDELADRARVGGLARSLEVRLESAEFGVVGALLEIDLASIREWRQDGEWVRADRAEAGEIHVGGRREHAGSRHAERFAPEVLSEESLRRRPLGGSRRDPELPYLSLRLARGSEHESENQRQMFRASFQVRVLSENGLRP